MTNENEETNNEEKPMFENTAESFLILKLSLKQAQESVNKSVLEAEAINIDNIPAMENFIMVNGLLTSLEFAGFTQKVKNLLENSNLVKGGK